MIKFRIGIIDDDDSMVLYLQGERNNRTFTIANQEYAFEIVQVKISEDMNKVIQQAFDKFLDALLIDFRINDQVDVTYQGIDLIERIEKNRPFYPAFLLTGYSDEAEQSVVDVNKVYEKTEFYSDKTCAKINQKIVRQIESYKKRINLAEAQLIELREKTELTADEEQQQLILENLVEGYSFGEQSMSPLFKKNSFSKDLAKLIQKTENLLSEIKNEKCF